MTFQRHGGLCRRKLAGEREMTSAFVVASNSFRRARSATTQGARHALVQVLPRRVQAFEPSLGGARSQVDYSQTPKDRKKRHGTHSKECVSRCPWDLSLIVPGLSLSQTGSRTGTTLNLLAPLKPTGHWQMAFCVSAWRAPRNRAKHAKGWLCVPTRRSVQQGFSRNDEPAHSAVHFTLLRLASAVPSGSIFCRASVAARCTSGSPLVASLRRAGMAERGWG
ncbi:MAG: hypothetical protein QOF48_3323 [Verrucomicrobiota bacterium]